MLYAYYSFNVYFFKILFVHVFWANLFPKSEVLQIDWKIVKIDRLLNAYFDFHVYFFQRFCHSYNFGQILIYYGQI